MIIDLAPLQCYSYACSIVWKFDCTPILEFNNWAIFPISFIRISMMNDFSVVELEFRLHIRTACVYTCSTVPHTIETCICISFLTE